MGFATAAGQFSLTEGSRTFFFFFFFLIKSSERSSPKFFFTYRNFLQRVLGDGLLVVRKIENVATGPNNRPKLACVIAECGEM